MQCDGTEVVCTGRAVYHCEPDSGASNQLSGKLGISAKYIPSGELTYIL